MQGLHKMVHHGFSVDEYRWARAFAEVLRVNDSFYIKASPEVRRSHERNAVYLAQFDTHKGRAMAKVVARRVMLVLEGVEPRPTLNVQNVWDNISKNLASGTSVRQVITDDIWSRIGPKIKAKR